MGSAGPPEPTSIALRVVVSPASKIVAAIVEESVRAQDRPFVACILAGVRGRAFEPAGRPPANSRVRLVVRVGVGA